MQDVMEGHVHGLFLLAQLLQHLKFGVAAAVAAIEFVVQHQCVVIKDKLALVVVIQK
jgi:hypothetical protein